MNTIHWFRKGLRLHDNPALLEACETALRGPGRVYPLFIIDPAFCSPETIGVNRYSFLLESLSDLDSSLRRAGSRLFVARGKPEDLLPKLADEVGIQLRFVKTIKITLISLAIIKFNCLQLIHLSNYIIVGSRANNIRGRHRALRPQ
jgi:deoxyribodipyrimidine photolyase